MKIKIFKDIDFYESLVEYNLDDPFEKIEDLKARLYYFDGRIMPESLSGQDYYYFCLIDEEKIIGILKLRTGNKGSIWHPEWKTWMMFVSIDRDYQCNGYSKLLIEECMKFCKERNLDLLMSGYSEIGWNRIRNNFRIFADKYEIKMLDDAEGPRF